MQYQNLKMSKQSQYRRRSKQQTQSDDSIPQQWGSVQKRLQFLQTSMLRLQKKNQKMEKRLQQQAEDLLVTFKKEVRKMIEQQMNDQKKSLATKQKQLQLENMKAQLEQLHSFIKRIEKKNNEMIREIKNSVVGVNEEIIDEKIQERLEKTIQRQQSYVDRAISELRKCIKDINKQPVQIRYSNKQPTESRYTENPLANSRSRVNHMKSNEKSWKGSLTEIAPNNNQDLSIEKPKSKSPKNISNNGNSRVSYLREKLKQFQETNKKFEQKIDKKSGRKQEDKKTVQKLKDFKNYLQQSESQLDQSNLQQNKGQVLSQSIKRWRGTDKYRYQ